MINLEKLIFEPSTTSIIAVKNRLANCIEDMKCERIKFNFSKDSRKELVIQLIKELIDAEIGKDKYFIDINNDYNGFTKHDTDFPNYLEPVWLHTPAPLKAKKKIN